MILDPVRFKEHLARMRRDREMQRDKLPVNDPPSLTDVIRVAIAVHEIEMLDQLYAAVEDSMGPDAKDFSVELTGPGMEELQAAFAELTMPTNDAEGSLELGRLFMATRVVLGMSPPNIVEGPGIPELRAALADVTIKLTREVSSPWWRLISAARLAVGENA